MPQLPESPARAGARGHIKEIAKGHGSDADEGHNDRFFCRDVGQESLQQQR
ncbi:hypothetical protein Egran_02558 [Elaphomyces granulatus]|uniref:Uncharacterized protein n=1 Tax=Elaphomyces granulatus TaxID=519963 RepID=A0A232LZU4_9EURO|nr:hypothetical protein Egran_02558 [Elaphomyces granulatus]